MAKQELKRKETEVLTTNGNGKQTEQTYTVDDSLLPTPQELADYKAIDPNLVKFLIEASTREQKHRHAIESEKIKLVNREGRRVYSMNLWGMFFAFIILLTGLGVSAYLIYLDKIITGSIFAGVTLLGGASLFIGNGNNSQKKK